MFQSKKKKALILSRVQADTKSNLILFPDLSHVIYFRVSSKRFAPFEHDILSVPAVIQRCPKFRRVQLEQTV